MKKHIQLTLLGVLFSFLLAPGVLLSSSNVTADEFIDSIRIKVPVACTLSGSISPGEEHNANIANGVYKTEIGTTNLKIICNDNSGFSVYAVGFTDNIMGKNVLSNVLNPSYDIATGTAENGDISNWSMKINTNLNDPYSVSIENGFNIYSSVPSRYVEVATRDTGTDSGQLAAGATITTTYAAYISGTQPTGTYTGQVKYILVHPAGLDPPQEYDTAPGYIAYYPNANSYVGAIAQQAIGQTDTSATLTAPGFIREGYGFAGWNDKFDYTGNYYGPNESITFEAGQYSGENKGLSLYAVWVESENTIQNWQGCLSLDQEATTALTDSRDGNTYAVAKLADGKCWTIENMRIDDSVNADAMLTGSDSLGYDFDVLPSSSNSWNSNTTLAQFNNSNVSEGNYSYGNYYSWPSAIASSVSYSIETANTSICPSGWRLPRGGQALAGSSNEYYSLIKSLANEEPNKNQSTGNGYYDGADYSNSIRKYPYNFVYSGRWYANSASTRGESGFYWTATSQGVAGAEAYYLYLNEVMVRPGNGHAGKYYGNAFRCVTD